MADLILADGFFVYIRRVPKSHYSWIPIPVRQYFENRFVIDARCDVMFGHEWVTPDRVSESAVNSKQVATGVGGSEETGTV